MQLEVDHLRRRLHHELCRGTPSSSNPSSNDDRANSYRPKSRTPPSESFSCDEDHHYGIEGGKLPQRFTKPIFTMYNGRTDPVKHVSQFNQRMVVHSKNETLICKVFPSSLGPVGIRWFDGLDEGSINSFKELTRAFGARFVSLPTEHDLKKSLTRKLVSSVRQLMDHIDEYKQVKEDQQQEKEKAKVLSQDQRDFKSERYNNNRTRRDFARHFGSTTAQVVSTVFREPPNRQDNQTGSGAQSDASSRPPLGTISVILAVLGRTGSHPFRVMSIARQSVEDLSPEPKRGRIEVKPALSFSDEDKVGTLQPHDDALTVTLRIGGYDVKRMLVDQGSGAEIMYLDLYKGLRLKAEDLACYDLPLVGFDGKIVIPKGQIKLPVQVRSEVVEVDSIVVDAYSPYTTIVARPWLHAMGAISSTPHLKVKYLSRNQVEELVGSQSMAR
ncbi:uncharacterized protein LOC142631453 [Castanea sativa]|uniref:uncharacterized protein LOC142631453 n=1 Tax=Castanea sativa TaxID=21020 RepID=UPI003F64DD93